MESRPVFETTNPSCSATARACNDILKTDWTLFLGMTSSARSSASSASHFARGLACLKHVMKGGLECIQPWMVCELTCHMLTASAIVRRRLPSPIGPDDHTR